MKRRDFVQTAATGTIAATLCSGLEAQDDHHGHDHEHDKCHLTYATPADAMKAPRETIAYVPTIYHNSDIKKPDYLSTVDLNPESKTYSQVVHRTQMPHVGDELHHFGWNACSSCHDDPEKSRRYLVVPGFLSSRIHIIDTMDPTKPKMHKVIEGDEIKRKTNLSTPHTVHCLASGEIMVSMLGDANGNGPGGFLLLDDKFNIKGKWENSREGMKYNYDYWYQPRHNVMISSEWSAPNTFTKGFDLEDVKAGKYGQQLHFWNWEEKEIEQTIDLGGEGLIPLEVRFHHNPDSTHGFVGAALSSSIWHWMKQKDKWVANKVIQVEPVEVQGWPFPVPGLITDLVLSMDDRFLYFSNWLHGDVRQYDVSDPANPKLTGRVWLGGNLKKFGSGNGESVEAAKVKGKTLQGGPQMLQLSLDGKRLYLTDSLFSVWDNQFYPGMKEHGSYMLQIDCDTDKGGMKLNEDFLVDFGKEPGGPARAHEIRFPNGDCTSDIWL